MPRGRRSELDELIIRPGTYFNPQTEMMIVVDDCPSMDAEIFNMEEFEGADWVLISDELPVDESAREELLENLQGTHQGRGGRGHFRAHSDEADRGLDEETVDEEEYEPDEQEGGAGFDEDE